MKYVAVTGCRGFLGHHLVLELLRRGYYVTGIDAETYAGIHPILDRPDFKYVKADIATLDHLPDVEAVINCAAETHVDNSLTDAKRFLHSNVDGVWNLLELVRAKRQYGMPLFLHLSTDEVFGPSVFPRQPDDPLRPANPYSASKAAADLLIGSYINTYKVPAILFRPTNLYGTGQYPEKLVPKTVRYLKVGRRMPIHGDGSAKRSWLSVHDAVHGLCLVLENGVAGATYQAGGNTTATVKEVVRAIGSAMGVDPATYLTGADPVAEYEYQRPGLDISYQVEDRDLRGLGWKPNGNFFADLPALVAAEQERGPW